MTDLGGAIHEYAVVDVETTGLYWRRDRVVSVAVARCDAAGRPITQWYSLVNPGCPMGASEIHGLTDDMVATAPRFEEIADELLVQLGGAVLVGHNINFDWRFLSNEYARHGATLPDHDAICTMALAGSLGVPVGKLNLEAVAAYCEVPLPRLAFHDAREDVLATAGVFAQLYPLAIGRGIDPVVHLEATTPPILRKTAKCAFVNPGRFDAAGPLVQGMHVVMTGETSTSREELFRRSLDAGLDVLSTVNAKTSLLVTNDVSSGTAKARDALALDVPMVDEATYLRLLDAVAPGVGREQVVGHAQARKAARPKLAGTRAPAPVATGPLAGRRVVLLGELDDRVHLEELVAHSGGVVSHNVTKNTSLVVLGSPYDSQRLGTAVGHGAEVLSPAEFLAKLHAGDDLSAAEGAEGAEGAAKVTQSEPRPDVVTPPTATVLPEPASVVVVTTAPPAWHPDPSGRFQYRYWDGAAWGPHVSTQGQTHLDPLP